MKSSTMKITSQHRRQLLKSLTLAGIALPAFGAGIWHARQRQQAPGERWIAAQGRDKSHFGLGNINPDTTLASNLTSGFRGHGICQNPVNTNKVVMISRRPGTIALEVDLLSGESCEFHSPANHHMHGHAAFSHDGHFLFTTESDFRHGIGKIIVRESNHYTQVGEFLSHGIGPHEIRMMPDSDTLVVANGGLRTHPDSGRKVLNLDTMRSTLSYIDSHNGLLEEEHSVPEAKASIRHFDIAADGTIAFGMQIQRAAMASEDLVPLAGIHQQGSSVTLLHADTAILNALNDYMGSVAVCSAQRTAAFTSPRGDMAVFWNIDSHKMLGYHRFRDVCGITISQDNQHFILTNSAGDVRQIATANLLESKQLRMHFSGMSWDNHLLSVQI